MKIPKRSIPIYNKKLTVLGKKPIRHKNSNHQNASRLNLSRISQQKNLFGGKRVDSRTNELRWIDKHKQEPEPTAATTSPNAGLDNSLHDLYQIFAEYFGRAPFKTE